MADDAHIFNVPRYYKNYLYYLQDYPWYASTHPDGLKDNWPARQEHSDSDSDVPDPKDSDAEEALKFLVHWMGDMHQPLHMSGREKGGNGAKVAWNGRSTSEYCFAFRGRSCVDVGWSG